MTINDSNSIFWQAEDARAGADAGIASRQAHHANMHAITAEKEAATANGALHGARVRAHEGAELSNRLAVAGIKLVEKLKTVETERDSLQEQLTRALAASKAWQELLTKPMEVIAQNNPVFKSAHEAQQELMASWMVGQRAFKELAIDYGIQLGNPKKK